MATRNMCMENAAAHVSTWTMTLVAATLCVRHAVVPIAFPASVFLPDALDSVGIKQLHREIAQSIVSVVVCAAIGFPALLQGATMQWNCPSRAWIDQSSGQCEDVQRQTRDSGMYARVYSMCCCCRLLRIACCCFIS